MEEDETINEENNQISEENNQVVEENITTIQTGSDQKDGQNKCPKCGGTDIALNVKKGMLRCNYCRHEFEPEKLEGLVEDIAELEGEVFTSGAGEIDSSMDSVVTLKCSSCGAEVVIDTENTTQARCHWCRNTLSINQQIPNGAVPDVVLPFKITKEAAKESIEKFVGKRKFYAHPKFKEEFSADNVMGVYFPYVVVDVNSDVELAGQGEHLVREYTIGSGDNEKTYYDADLYDVERKFDLTIKGLTVESNLDKLDKTNKKKTNNIINSIMPFDTENCAKWDANYIKGYSSEKRDANVEILKPLVDAQSKDIARHAANVTLSHYDRGVRWDKETLNVKGRQWKTAYLPVWLYSYQEVKSEDNKILHYVAVNARTQETMGSVPVHMPKLLLISAIIELLGLMVVLFTEYKYRWLVLLLGFIFFFVIKGKYRNSSARHFHEKETTNDAKNMIKQDNYVRKLSGLSNSTMNGANNTNISGNKNVGNELLDTLRKSSGIDRMNILKK